MKPALSHPSPPQMPNVARAALYLPDAMRALERAQQAWNATQLRDALRSAEHFIATASKALDEGKPTAAKAVSHA